MSKSITSTPSLGKPIFDTRIVETFLHGLDDDAKCYFIGGLCTNPNAIDWLEEHVNPSLYVYSYMCGNPNAVHLIEPWLNNEETWWNELDCCEISMGLTCPALLEKYKHVLDWYAVSSNPCAIGLIETNLDKIQFHRLCYNPNAVHILEQHLDKINWLDWFNLCANPNACRIIEKNIANVNMSGMWKVLSGNPNAVHILENNLDKVHWSELSRNPNAVHLLEKNPDKIDWSMLCANTNEKAICMLEQNPDKIDWTMLACNHSAVRLLTDKLASLFVTPNAITCDFAFNLGTNTSIKEIMCKLNLEAMRAQCQPFAQELVAYVFHPSRIMRLCDAFNLDMEEYLELLSD